MHVAAEGSDVHYFLCRLSPSPHST